jgi:hypothetical protein
MKRCHILLTMLFAMTAMIWLASPAHAVSPRNPYRTFNLSGINYGSMRWEQAQRQGRSVWPYYNTPVRSSRNSGATVGGAAIGAGGMGAITSGSRVSQPGRRRR